MSLANFLKDYEGKWVCFNGSSGQLVVKVDVKNDLIFTARNMGGNYLTVLPVAAITSVMILEEQFVPTTELSAIPWDKV